MDVVAARGIVGDRFFGKAAHMDAAVTFLAAEALEEIATELGTGPLDPLLTRRNVVVRGAELNPLIGNDFAIRRAAAGTGAAAETAADSGSAVWFRGGRPANPCAWMDRMLAPGAHAAMRGRGGIRCMPITTGQLWRGAAILVSPVELDARRAGARPPARRLP